MTEPAPETTEAPDTETPQDPEAAAPGTEAPDTEGDGNDTPDE